MCGAIMKKKFIMKIRFLFLGSIITFMILLTACAKWRNEDLPITTDCGANSVTAGSVNCLAHKGGYVYTSAYGGRDIVQPDQTGLNGALSVVLPDGWYSGRQASIIDSDLQNSNIVNTFNFFGVNGSLTAGAYGACTVNTGISAPASCTLPASNYVYTAADGG